MKHLDYNTKEHKEAVNLQRAVIRLFEKIVPYFIGEELKDMDRSLMGQLRKTVTLDSLNAFICSHTKEWEEIAGAIQEEATSEGLLRLIEKMNLHVYQLHNETFIQLDYSKLVGRWWNLLTRNSRGHLYRYPELELISLPFQKFYNINEREETQLHALDMKQSLTIMEKLDGTMIHLFEVGGTIVSATRGSVGEYYYNDKAIAFVEKAHYQTILELIQMGYTPMFELLLREEDEYGQTVRYQEEDLRLIAIRHRETGAYVHPTELQRVAKELDVQSATDYREKNMYDILEEQKEVKNFEGWVVYFEDGTMVKLKAEDYLKLNYTYGLETRMMSNRHMIEKTLYTWLQENIYDDQLSSIKSDEFRMELEETLQKIEKASESYLRMIRVKLNEHYSDNRKNFAKALSKDDTISKSDFSLIFELYKGKEVGLKEVQWGVIEAFKKRADFQTNEY